MADNNDVSAAPSAASGSNFVDFQQLSQKSEAQGFGHYDGILDGLENAFPTDDSEAGAEPADDVEAAPASDKNVEAEDKADKDKDEAAPSKGAEKRISQLVARAKEAESKLHTAEHLVEQYQAAFEILKAQLDAKNARLQEIDDISPQQAELESLRLQRAVAEKERELEDRFQTRLQKAQFDAAVQAESDRLIGELQAALKQYPGVSQQDVALAWQRNKDASPIELAKTIYEMRLKTFEPEVLKRQKPAPKPTHPSSAKPTRKITSDEELFAELDARLGKDWGV
jgi:hypothetical protein